MTEHINPYRQHIREGMLPHFFCPGCGCGLVLNYFLRATADLGIDLGSIVAVGGVGCAARIPVYLHVDALHGIHGRTLPWAMGIKLARPETRVVIFAGDGDAASIGGNHLLHAARRNLDVTMIVVNNLNFGMTGGQVAPSTPFGAVTTTTPYGSAEPTLDACRIAVTAGATYVARWTTGHPHQAIAALKKALTHKGFGFVEIVSQCPTQFGRYALGTDSGPALLEWIGERALSTSDYDKLPDKEKPDHFAVGEFVCKEAPVFGGSTVYGKA